MADAKEILSYENPAHKLNSKNNNVNSGKNKIDINSETNTNDNLKPKVPDVYIQYSNLSITVKISEKQASRTLTTIPSLIKDAITSPFRKPNSAEQIKEFKVLNNLNGIIKPGLTLVISPPGGGKTSFLKALASLPGSLKLDEGSSVLYNGKTTTELLQENRVYYNQLVQYIDQLDNHFTFLTVRETCEFIAENALASIDKEGAVSIYILHHRDIDL